jgi:hypothetical protein
VKLVSNPRRLARHDSSASTRAQFHAKSAIWAIRRLRGLTTIQKVVLYTLTAYAGGDGESYPSCGSIAEDSNCSKRAVQKALRGLVAKGLMTVTADFRVAEPKRRTGMC